MMNMIQQHQQQQQTWEQEMKQARAEWETRISNLQSQLEQSSSHTDVEAQLQQQLQEIQQQLKNQIETTTTLQQQHIIALETQSSMLKQQYEMEIKTLQAKQDDGAVVGAAVVAAAGLGLIIDADMAAVVAGERICTGAKAGRCCL